MEGAAVTKRAMQLVDESLTPTNRCRDRRGRRLRSIRFMIGATKHPNKANTRAGRRNYR
jgi:hypothetical protein